MSRVRLSLVLAFVAGVPALAPQGAAAGNLGGGFIEAVSTGFAAEAPRNPVFNPQMQTRQVLREPQVVREPQVLRSQQTVAYAPQEQAVQRTVPPQYLRTEVAYATREKPGTIVVDTPDKYLYLVQGDGRALRYGIGVGRPGFSWSGVKTVTRKAEWPDWTPPDDMLKRRPDLPRHMDGGPANPLGARALYLGSSLYRIHGTNEPWTIGQNVSSGCIRMMNEDVTDLYTRVGVGTKVVVL
ncbi:MAG: L,D-transpeptidase [Hyphomicrobiales bacterium]|nr:L,D-transpeptidase [Hyphomicrobiales bacterium]